MSPDPVPERDANANANADANANANANADALSRWDTWAPFALLALTCLAFALPLLDPSVQLFDRDTGRCEAPFKLEMWRRLSHGQLPLWVPWAEGGTSLLGQMTPALFHPLALLYAALPFEWAFKLNHLLALPLAMWGLFRLARRSGASPWAACAGAAVFGGSGWMVSMTASNLHYALGLAAVPLALDGLLRLLDRPGPGRLLWASFALALPVLAGEPQSGIFAGLLGVGAAAAWALEERSAPFLTRARRAVPWLTLWGLGGVLLSGPASFPVAARIPDTARPGGPSAVEASAFVVEPLRLTSLALPWVLDETMEQLTPAQGRSPFFELSRSSSGTPFSTSISLGAVALLLAGFSLRRRLGRWLLGGALVCVLASLGPLLPVERALLTLLPPLSLFRYAEKWIAPATLLVSLAAALGADQLLSAKDAARRRADLRFALGAGAVLIVLALGVRFAREGLIEWARLRTRSGSLSAAALVIDTLVSSLSTQGLLVLVLQARALPSLRPAVSSAIPALVCALAAWTGSARLLFVAPLEALRTLPPLAEHLEARAGPSAGRWRVDADPDHSISLGDLDWRLGLALWEEHTLTPQFNGLFGIETVAIYSSLVRKSYADAWHAAPAQMASLFDVRFNLRSPWALTADDAKVGGYVRTPLGQWLRENPPQPRAFLSGCAHALARDARLSRMAEAAFDAHGEALLPAGASDVAARIGCSAAVGKVALERRSPEEFALTIESARPALVVVSEQFDAGWSVAIDEGARGPALEIDGAALGAEVPAGRHVVRLRFWPRGLTAGLLAALACLLAAGGWLAISLAAKRPRARGRLHAHAN